jgi:mRNA-degrading endonuclease RelE of RelBE toxin-antitoxin system
MEQDPFSGDVIPLTNERSAFRRRVGDWRIFFDVYRERTLVEVTDIERRSSTTYRKRT